MSGAMFWDIVLRVVNGTILLAITVWLLLSIYRKIRYRFAYGLWPKKTREEIAMEEENKRSLEELMEEARYHGDPNKPGSGAYHSDRYREDVERMLEAGKSPCAELYDPYER